MDKEPSIMVREPDATMQPAPQDNQLMSKHRVLSFKPQLRLKWRGQDGQNETEQPDHSASLVDSITSSTRIRFSVHTTTGFLAASITARFGPTESGNPSMLKAPSSSTSPISRQWCRNCSRLSTRSGGIARTRACGARQ